MTEPRKKSASNRFACPVQRAAQGTAATAAKAIHSTRLHGSYRRACDGRRLRRFYCVSCRKTFSEATATLEFRQRRRSINQPLFKQLASNTSLRRSAVLIGVTRRTVDRRLIYFDKVATLYQEALLANMGPVSKVQFDDMESSIHTKLKPVSIPLAVEQATRIILSFDVASMPAKGRLAATSVRKYGKRADERGAAWKHVLSKVFEVSKPGVTISSDKHKRYPFAIQTYLPGANHVKYPSRRATIAGQGEMKEGGRDPLFAVNHTAAMFRANVCRLIRRTWCTSKRQDRLRSHMNLYTMWHNENIIAKTEKRKPRFPFNP